MKSVHIVSVILVLVGALNWGLIGLLNLNLITSILGSSPGLEKLVYILIGLAGLLLAFTHKGECKACK